MNTGDYYTCLYGSRHIEGALGATPVDAFQQHGKLCATERNRSTLGLRPHKSTPLQTLGKQAKAIAVEPEALDDVAAPATEHKDMA